MRNQIKESKKEPPVRLEGISKSFGKMRALEDISLTVERGEVFGLIGPNGSGKSTLLGIACGIIRPDRGTVMVFGQDPSRCLETRRRIGVLFQHTELFDRIRVGEAILFFSSLYSSASASADRIVTALDLDRKIRSCFKHLSGGEKQKLGIILAFLGSRDLLLLDEPGSNLDVSGKRQLRKLIEVSSQRGAAVLISSHELSEIGRLCDRVAILKDGRIIAMESPSRILQSVKGGLVVELETQTDEILDEACRAMVGPPFTAVRSEGRLIFDSPRPVEFAIGLLNLLEKAGKNGWRLEIRQPKLADACRRYMR